MSKSVIAICQTTADYRADGRRQPAHERGERWLPWNDSCVEDFWTVQCEPALRFYVHTLIRR